MIRFILVVVLLVGSLSAVGTYVWALAHATSSKESCDGEWDDCDGDEEPDSEEDEEANT